jgi:hypothetical protein
VIVNRVHYENNVNAASSQANLPGVEGEDIVGELEDALGDPDLASRAAASLAEYGALAASDRRNIERLTAELRARRVIRVPYLDEDVHDLGGLMEVNRYLFATGAEREALAASR